jgi:hypothetical protein
MPTPEMSKRSINSQKILVISLRSWKFNQEPRLTTKDLQNQNIISQKNCVENYSQEHLYPKPKTLVFLMGHI